MLLRYLGLFFCLCFSTVSAAKEMAAVELQAIQWFQGPLNTSQPTPLWVSQSLTPVEAFSLTGGDHVSLLNFDVNKQGLYVIDFRNSTLIGRYQHYLYDANNQLVASSRGGIDSVDSAHFFLRHGQEVQLAPGRYSLVTAQRSQFNIAPPTTFVMEKSLYLEDIRIGNAITLTGIGILLSLFFYYLVLSIARKNLVDFSYAMFILGNLLFNSTSLLVAHHLLGIQWFGGASWPILCSNMAYLVFVMQLLEVKSKETPMVYYVGCGLLVLFAMFFSASFFLPNWQNEFNRHAVGLFISFGMFAGIRMIFKGSKVARWYVLANLGFFVLAAVAISQEQIAGLQTIYMSHIGLIAVVVEVMLLSCVVAYQMTRVEEERNAALVHAQQMLELASTDTLTGLPNRYALENRLPKTNKNEAFIYLDLDGLKICNDQYGHDMGDKLLLVFSEKMRKMLPSNCELFRISGDEFGVILPNSQLQELVDMVHFIDKQLREEVALFVGVSFGVAYFKDHKNYRKTIEEADHNMYLYKRNKQSHAT